MDDFGGSAVYAVGGGGLVWLAQMLWTKIFSTEGKGNDALVEQLTDRITAQEVRLVSLEQGLDDERKARRAAESKVYALQLDNVILRAELKRHGITVPPATGDQSAPETM